MFNKDEYYRLQNKVGNMYSMLESYKRGELMHISIDYEATYNLYKAECSYLSYLTYIVQRDRIILWER